MFLRFFTFLIVVIFCTSCDKFSYSENKNLQVADTIVDFTSVDFSPSFKVCDSLIDKEKKSNCFRNTIHKKIGVELQKHSLTIKDSINEVVFVDILITKKGEVIFQEITSTENLKQQLPQLDSLLRQSVQKLAYIYPAIKRGIPVTTIYKLPIRILFKD
tara:strand:+ start:3869 stop:4345 length:477 start_codon:yes stop_codon:yes gene_type:complete